MDPTSYSSTESVVQQDDSSPNPKSISSNNISARSDGINHQQLHNTSIVPLIFDGQDHLPIEGDIATIKANNKQVSYNCYCIATGDIQNPSLGDHDIANIDGNMPFQEQGLHKVSTLSATEDLSELSSADGYESSNAPKSSPTVVSPEHDFCSADELDKDLMVSWVLNLCYRAYFQNI